MLFHTDAAHFLRLRSAQIRLAFIIDAHKQLRVIRIQRQTQDRHDIRHHTMGKERHIRAFQTKRDLLPVQQIDQRQRTLVIPIQYRRFRITVFRHFSQIRILPRTLFQLNVADVCCRLSGRYHMLFMTGCIVLYERIRCCYDLCIGAIVPVHHQHLRSGMVFFKMQQCLRIRRTETVDTLVLVSDHKQVSVFSGQQFYDHMLDSGSILRLIHADVLILLPVISKQFRNFVQQIITVDHLIIIIHQLIVPKISIVFLIRFQQWHLFLFPDLSDLL